MKRQPKEKTDFLRNSTAQAQKKTNDKAKSTAPFSLLLTPDERSRLDQLADNKPLGRYIHELRGFVSNNLVSAPYESYAVSRGTRAKQVLFSLSLNPPPSENVSTDDFEDTIQRA